MNRVLLKNFEIDNKFVFETSDKNFVIFSGEDFLRSDVFIEVKHHGFLNILLTNLNKELNIHIHGEESSNITVECLFSGELKNIKITANLDKFAAISGYFADFAMKDLHSVVDVHLNGEGASATWNVASVSAGNDNKKFEISLYHHVGNTYGNIDNYGVSKDEGKLLFSGVSHIEKGAKNSKTKQNAKIMVFDRYSNAIAKPILKIDENEIEASHAATVGKISDDELFYLTSRGLKEETAKELITLGYIKPIINKFSDEEIQNEILSLIERRM